MAVVPQSAAGAQSTLASGLERVDWPAVVALLEAGQYGPAADRLAQVRRACERANQLVPANLLGVIQALCQVCAQCHTQAEWHRRSQTQAVQQEQEFRDYLHAIIRLLDGPHPGDGAPPDAPTPSPQLFQRLQEVLTAPLLRPSLTQFLQMLTGHAPGDGSPLPAEAEVITPPVESDPALAARPTNGQNGPAATGEPSLPEAGDEAPLLVVYCLGAFRVYQDDQALEDWPGRKGKTLFKYLLLNRQQTVPKELLMDLLWPDSDPDAARNNLNVAIYGLRQALHQGRPEFSHILFQDGNYLLNPALHLWLDSDEFEARARSGRQFERQGQANQALREYAVASSLYRGALLQEDLYEDWLLPQRHYLQDIYLDLMRSLSRFYLDQGNYPASISTCNEMLAIEPCLEDIHCRLMTCYQRLGQRYLALRQFHLCVQILREDLDIAPMPSTLELHQHISEGLEV